MTKEEIIKAFRFIVKKCDNLINNKDYLPDAYTTDNVEDIAELCNRIIDGDFGDIVEDLKQSTLPSNLDEAAKNYCRNNDPTNQKCYDCILEVFKEGAEWMAGQFEKDIISLIESRIGEILGDAQPAPVLRAELRELIDKIKEK